jgi:ribosomal protein S18 acetylase RimI-like enzyme
MTSVAPSNATTEVALRPVTDADRDFLVGVYGSSRDEELSQVEWAPGQREAFIRMQFDAQDADYRKHNPDGSFDVIEVEGRPAGRLYVDRRPGDIRIVDISLLPEFRGAGTGKRLIEQLMDEAASSGRILSIHVEIHNRAAHLYERLGFVVAAERGVYRRMEWSPP